MGAPFDLPPPSTVASLAAEKDCTLVVSSLVPIGGVLGMTQKAWGPDIFHQGLRVLLQHGRLVDSRDSRDTTGELAHFFSS